MGITMNIEIGKLYFVKDDFYSRFKDFGLLTNKEEINGQQHNRPCCCVLNDKQFNENNNIYWFIPISSQVAKYQSQYQKSIDKYGMCDNISFGFVLGRNTAFLPQNLFPITDNYINNVYVDNNTLSPITIHPSLMSKLCEKARKKIRYNKQGKCFGLSDVMGIYQELISDDLSGDKSNNKILLYQ